MSKVFFTLYLFIIIGALYFFSSNKSNTTIPPQKNKPDSITPIQKTAKPGKKLGIVIMGFIDHNNLCIREELEITDTTDIFTKKVCDWGDGSTNTIYQHGSIKASHPYNDTGMKRIIITADSRICLDTLIHVYCQSILKDSLSLLSITRDDDGNSIYNANAIINIKQSEKIGLEFYSPLDLNSYWVINGDTNKNYKVKQSFSDTGTVKIKYVPGQTCLCDSTFQLYFRRGFQSKTKVKKAKTVNKHKSK